MGYVQHPERRPVNDGRTPLDRYCRSCGSLPTVPCTIRGVQSPATVRTHEDERAWKLSHIRAAQEILKRLDGGQRVPVGDLVKRLRQADRTLIHSSR